MNFERPNVNMESNKFEENSTTPDFLQEQVRLPKDQWNEKFLKLVEEKIRENQKENNENLKELPEILQESTVRRYLEGLGLSEEKLKDKKVLDLGTGDGDFIKYLIEKDITQEAYGIDVAWNENSVEDKLKPHFFRGNFEEDLPIKNADYIISVGAVSNGIWAGEERMDIRRIIEKSLNALKKDGEILIYPIQEAAKATPLEGLQASQQKWDALLKEISNIHKVECKIEPRDIKVSGKNNDIILESVLIIKRKPELSQEKIAHSERRNGKI